MGLGEDFLVKREREWREGEVSLDCSFGANRREGIIAASGFFEVCPRAMNKRR